MRNNVEELLEALHRCNQEIEEPESYLRSGGDIDGGLLWLYDWRCEKALIEKELAMFTATNDRDTLKKKPLPKSKTVLDKVEKVMGEFKSGDLESSSGTPVTGRKQALAIALSEARRKAKK